MSQGPYFSSQCNHVVRDLADVSDSDQARTDFPIPLCWDGSCVGQITLVLCGRVRQANGGRTPAEDRSLVLSHCYLASGERVASIGEGESH